MEIESKIRRQFSVWKFFRKEKKESRSRQIANPDGKSALVDLVCLAFDLIFALRSASIPAARANPAIARGVSALLLRAKK